MPFVMKFSNGQQNIQINSVAYFNYVQQFIHEYLKKWAQQKAKWHTIVQQINVFYNFVKN